ncbi:uncharacterized protein LOC122945997 isoform X5 [Bufo gargarizans]|uniref:uncharacterized protein LOC122945997 isoform X5 n=1 Tax=Bufo gargarizans TaxID=30331 RepID=UPI001CF4EA3C|nr:uncharacterized protein LOC122945997 isoform X5 [Bufo gargarizans]
MMEHCHSFKSLDCTMVKPGVMVKIEEEELYDPHYDGRSETSTGYPLMNPETMIKEERNEEDSFIRNEEMYEEEESPESSIGEPLCRTSFDISHYVKNVVVKRKKDDGAHGIVDQQFEERISSPEPSPDYILVKIKEEEAGEPYGMNYQRRPIGKGTHRRISMGREKDGRVHRISSKMVIDIDRLIQMVHDRPELYDPKVPSYADRYKKKKAWDEICSVVVPGWDRCSEKEKNLKAKEIQTRWRSLKDCFRRELTLQKKLEKSGISTNRRRKYVHYDGLLFLEPTIKLRDPFGGSAAPTPASNNREPVEILQPFDIERSVSPTPLPPPLPPPPAPAPTFLAPKRNRKKAVNTSESEWESHLLNVMNTLKMKTEEKSDSDEIFLRSLLPFVKKVPDERKIDMQLSMMHVVKRFMKPLPPIPHCNSNNSAHIPPQPTLKPHRKHRHQRLTSPQPSLSVPDPSRTPTTPQTQPAVSRNSQQENSHGPQPYSSPSSSSSSINPSPQSHRDSPYYFDL